MNNSWHKIRTHNSPGGNVTLSSLCKETSSESLRAWTSLGVQWLRFESSTAGPEGLIPDWAAKTPYAAWHSRENKRERLRALQLEGGFRACLWPQKGDEDGDGESPTVSFFPAPSRGVLALCCPLPPSAPCLLGIQSVEVQLENQMVLVQTTLPSQEVQALLEGTGRQAVLKGMGSGLLRE